jgi:hypothetical protein
MSLKIQYIILYIHDFRIGFRNCVVFFSFNLLGNVFAKWVLRNIYLKVLILSLWTLSKPFDVVQANRITNQDRTICFPMCVVSQQFLNPIRKSYIYNIIYCIFNDIWIKILKLYLYEIFNINKIKPKQNNFGRLQNRKKICCFYLFIYYFYFRLLFLF